MSLRERALQIASTGVITIKSHPGTITLAHGNPLGQVFLSLVLQGLEKAVRSWARLGVSVATDRYVIRKRHQVFKEEKESDAMLVNAVRKRKIEFAILQIVRVMKVVDHRVERCRN